MTISRRKFLASIGVVGAVGVLGPVEGVLAQQKRKIVLRDTITPADTSRYSL